jgi:regulator of sigma E protease
VDLSLFAASSGGEFWLWLWNLLVVIFQVSLGLGVVIFVHELGHFLVAKACGVKCEKFLVGFDVPIKIGPWQLPRTLWKKQIGETLYAVGIIPLGGYVKMLGQDDNPANAAAEAERTKIRKTDAEGDESAQVAPNAEAGAGESANQEEEFEIDPRSYTAKNVPQRMAIISAGVITNLIFALIFATIAFRMGAPFNPCVLGTTVAGTPAYVEDLPPGGRVVQIHEHGRKSDYLRFRMDLLQNVGITGGKEDIAILMRLPNGEEKWFTLRPERITINTTEVPILGIQPIASTTLPPKKHVVEGQPAAKEEGLFQGNDTIVAIRAGEQEYEIESFVDLRRVLCRHAEDELTFVVRRGKLPAGVDGGGDSDDRDKAEATVAANPMRRLGLSMKMEPVLAVQKGSPADGKLNVGDVIRSVDGHALYEPFEYEGKQIVLDPVTLPHYLRWRAGKALTFIVEREVGGEGTEIEVAITPRAPEITAENFYPIYRMSADAVGIAYEIDNTVEFVRPGSPAAEAGFQVGDVLTSAKFVAADDDQRAIESDELMLDEKPIALGDAKHWLKIVERLQYSMDDTKVELEFTRDDETKTATVASFDSEVWFNENRGMRLVSKQEICKADSWGQAMLFGWRNTVDSMTHVLRFLRNLTTGRISPTNLGGPLTIAAIAGGEAQAGIPRLLLFLTLLSANLAIINFLPIPVLDGGHMVFLLYEGVRGKPVDERWAMGLTLAGLVFILGLMVFVIGMDLYRFASWLG